MGNGNILAVHVGRRMEENIVIPLERVMEEASEELANGNRCRVPQVFKAYESLSNWHTKIVFS